MEEVEARVEQIKDTLLPGWRDNLLAAIAAQYEVTWQDGERCLRLTRNEEYLGENYWMTQMVYEVEGEDRKKAMTVFRKWFETIVREMPTTTVWICRTPMSHEKYMEGPRIYEIQVPVGIKITNSKIRNTKAKAQSDARDLSCLSEWRGEILQFEGKFEVFVVSALI